MSGRPRAPAVAVVILAVAACRGAPAAAPLDLPAPPPARDFGPGVTVRLVRVWPGGGEISFGVPVPAGIRVIAAEVGVERAGAPVPGARVRQTLARGHGAAALQVRLPAKAASAGSPVDLEVVWRARHPAGAAPAVPFAASSAASPETVTTVELSLAATTGGARVVPGAASSSTLFVGREPVVTPMFPAGYLAATGIFGPLVTAVEAASGPTRGLAFFSEAARAYGRSAIHATGAPTARAALEPHANAGQPEAWLYDRCATLLLLHAHTGDGAFLRAGFRACAHYASQIALHGERAGTFLGKRHPDLKYSHLRGLFAYVALTGDESAATAARAIADMWLRDSTFVGPYRAGRLRAPDKLWTERLLGGALEGLVYGHLFFGGTHYLQAARELVTTAHAHVTGDAAALARLNPGVGPFPPQGCFVHSAQQHSEGNAGEPWCSGWMAELAVEPLLAYQSLTQDARVDEIFVRLTRFLRDVGTQHFRKNPLGDTFLRPAVCFDPRDEASPRVLVPLYGAGVRADGTRAAHGEWDDFEHCPDATLLTAAGLRALARGAQPGPPPPPFTTEAESFVALHHELAACARFAFAYHHRPQRALDGQSAKALGRGLGSPAKFLADQKIGHAVWHVSPQRKLSWWFNGSLLQFALLRDAGVAVPALVPGRVQPASCK